MGFPRSGTVDTQTFSGTKDFVMARSSALQNSNIAAADHLKLDTIDFSRPSVANTPGSASAVSLDTATAYVNTVGAASLGRFSLRGGKVYKLTAAPGYVLFSGATGLLTLQFFDVTTLGSPVAIGQPGSVYTQADASQDGHSGAFLQAMYNAGGGQNDVFLVEVQITVATAVTSIGNVAKGMPTALVETY